MRSNRSAETGPERALRKALWTAGIRGYRKNVKDLPGKPDIVFTKTKVCIFVHGCFWHQCPNCAQRRNLKPTLNATYWLEKFERNIRRDRENERRLMDTGWSVVTIWECELTANPGECIERIAANISLRLAPDSMAKSMV